MKAPSPQCLHALRLIAIPRSITPACSQVSRRWSSSQPPPPPKPTSKPLTRQPTEPGFRLRQKPDDDEAHIPQPLSSPIGLPHPPQPGQNRGQDTRSMKNRRDDFVDYDKHLVKREKMRGQISKPYFRDWSNLRFHKGKVFLAPERLFRAEWALFFPNFFGRILRRKGVERGEGKRDGYGGLGRDTCVAMRGKVSVVSLVTNAWASNQVATFCGKRENAALTSLLEENGDVAQRIEINYENNTLKYWILRLFGMSGLRRSRSPEQQERYFIVRRGVSEPMKEALGFLNEKAGFVYLVDPQCRIRWAGSAVAEERERESLVRGTRRLILEVRGMDGKSQLRHAVEEVVEEEEKEAARASG